MAFKKKVKLKYGEWEVPAGGQTVPNPLPLQPGASPPLLPQEVGSTPGEEDSRERLFPHPPSLSFFSFYDKCPVIWAPYTARQGALDQNRPTMNCLIPHWTEHVE